MEKSFYKTIIDLKNKYIETAGNEPNYIVMDQSCYDTLRQHYINVVINPKSEPPKKVFDMNIIIDNNTPSMYVGYKDDFEEIDCIKQMSEEEKLDKAINILVQYCKSTDCTECKFAHHIEVECGIHNPSAWKGENKIE